MNFKERQKNFLKMSPYKRKKLVDGVIKILKDVIMMFPNLKEDNPHSENLKKTSCHEKNKKMPQWEQLQSLLKQ